MNERFFVRLSDPILTVLNTDKGELPILGTHALAGLRFEGTLFDSGIPFDWITFQELARRQAYFWSTLWMGLENTSGPWQTSFELRAVHRADQEEPCEASLWVKAFAPEDYVADQAASELAEMVSVLYPLPCRLQPVTSLTDFDRLWGKDDLQWLAEIRRAFSVTKKNQIQGEQSDCTADESDPQETGYGLSGFSPSPQSWRDLWGLLRRLRGTVWLSIGVCPTRLFPSEVACLHNIVGDAVATLAEKTDDLNRFEEASVRHEWMRGWQQGAFLLRIRVGGELKPVQWLSQAIAAALIDPGGDDRYILGSLAPPVIAFPETALDWQAARFNWQWADFQAWGEESLPASLRRMRYLFETRELGLLAGVWW